MSKQNQIEIPKYVLEGNQNIPEDLKKVLDYFRDCGNKNYQVCLVGEKESIAKDLKEKGYQGKEFIHLDNKNLNKNYPFLPISIKNAIRRINKLVMNSDNGFNKIQQLGIHTLGLVPVNEINQFNGLDYGLTSWHNIKVYARVRPRRVVRRTTRRVERRRRPTVEEPVFNHADLMFVQGMIPHHKQAMILSDYALDPLMKASAAILNLASQIKAAQGPEIKQLTDFLKTWGQPMNMEMEMHGMLTPAELDALKQLEGQEFDQAWLRSMIVHHKGAVMMANDVIQKGINSEVFALAKDIIDGQVKEINTMQALLTP